MHVAYCRTHCEYSADVQYRLLQMLHMNNEIDIPLKIHCQRRSR